MSVVEILVFAACNVVKQSNRGLLRLAGHCQPVRFTQQQTTRAEAFQPEQRSSMNARLERRGPP